MLLAQISLIIGCTSPSPNSESYVRAGYDFADHDLVAIVDVVGEIESEHAKNQIADLFTLELLRKGFAPIQREHVLRLLRESGFEKGDLSPEAYAIEAGRVLQVPAVLIIHIPTFGDEASLTAKILEVRNGSALWLGYGSGRKPDESWAVATRDPFQEQLSGSIFQSHGMTMENPEQPEAAVDGPVTSALTPRELAPFRIITRDICKSIPQRTAEMSSQSQYPLPGFGN
jgi:hypothetical protein